MKNTLLVLFLFSISVNYSQNCLFTLDVKSYKTDGKYFSKKKHKNIQIILKTEECLCTENVFEYFINSNYYTKKKKHKNIQIILKTEECLCTENVFEYFINSNYYTNGRIISSDYKSDDKYFLLSNKKRKIEIIIKDNLLTIEETSGNKHTKYTSTDFTSKWLD